MKSTLNFRNTSFLVVFLFTVSFLTSCNSSQKSSSQDSITKKSTPAQDSKKAIATNNADSVELTQLIRKLYKWHETAKTKFDGFKPLKRNATDTLYTSIDLDENQKAIEELLANNSTV